MFSTVFDIHTHVAEPLYSLSWKTEIFDNGEAWEPVLL